MEKIVIVNDAMGQYPIRPKDLMVSEATHTAGHFGKYEIEAAAGILLLFFQEFNKWKGFTINDLYWFLNANHLPTDHIFFGLCGYWYDDATIAEMSGRPWTPSPPYVVCSDDGKFYITELFIERLKEK